jgi:hypothetical protein
MDTEPRTSVSMDARQRVILSTNKGGVNQNGRIVCAEPSPDAIVSIAASGLLKVPVGEKNLVDIDARSAEAVAKLGTRTSTIQLLRDGLYRACEAYLNGAIDKDLYLDIIVMFDDFVVTVFAIDELTKLQVTPASTSPQAVSTTVQPPSPPSAPQPPQPSPSLQPAPLPSPTTVIPGLTSSPLEDVPQVIQNIVFRYLQHQKEIYNMLWKSSGQAAKGERSSSGGGPKKE